MGGEHFSPSPWFELRAALPLGQANSEDGPSFESVVDAFKFQKNDNLSSHFIYINLWEISVADEG